MLTSIFLALVAIFETLEYMLCYKDEKRKFMEDIHNNRAEEMSDKIEETPLLNVNSGYEGNAVEMQSLNVPFNYAAEDPDRNSIVQINCDSLVDHLDEEEKQESDHYQRQMLRVSLRDVS